MKKYPQNFGLIIEPPAVTDFKLGGISKVGNINVLQADGHGWGQYLPALEVQYGTNFDTMACVTFSALNAIETLINRIFSKAVNKSDRFTAKMSGTTAQGNSQARVAESIRKLNGSVDETVWSFPRHDSSFGFNEFYADIPSGIVAQGMDFLKEYKVAYEWVPFSIANVLFALQYAPLQVVGFAWENPVNGVYQRTDKTANHAFLLYDYVLNDHWMIYDNYDNDFKKLAWDYNFTSAMKYSIELAPQINTAFLATLKAKGLQYIQRAQAQGQVYRLDTDSITFLDSHATSDGHIPLYDEVIKVLVSQKKLTGISEADFTKLTTV